VKIKDLIVLAADKDMAQTLRGIFERPEALGIRKIDVDLRVEEQHDPGCAQRGVTFLSIFSGQYRYGLLLFDHHGSGREKIPPLALQETLNRDFGRTGWGDRARTIVLEPELEAWVWGASPHVAEVAGWKSGNSKLRQWLRDESWLKEGEVKPERPALAFKAALRRARKSRSSSLYYRLAQKVSLARCEDRAFRELKEVLREWFPPSD